MRKLQTCWMIGAVLVLGAACTRPASMQGFAGATMGSSFEVKVVTELPLAEVEAMVHRELAAFDLAFSNWRDNSELRRVNAHRSSEPLAVSERFALVLQQALAIAQATDGAFDPTMRPLSELYRTAKEHPELGLDDAQLLAAKERVGYQKLSLVDGQLVKLHPEVQLDLDGIVAGAAVDAIAEQLQALGIDAFYLQVTGEVLCRGVKPDGTVWRIGVVNPASDIVGGQTAIVTLPLLDRALCSSGDYRNAVIVGGRVVHHLFDPRTGRNPEHSVVSASVIAKSCAVADALGTAMMVMGADEARRLWPSLQLLGAEGALFLKPGEDDSWVQLKIDWPDEG